MPNSTDETADRLQSGRRRLLAASVLSFLAGSGVVGAWHVTRPEQSAGPTEPPGGPLAKDEPEPNGSTNDSSPPADSEPTNPVPAIVRRYAPDLYFGALEKWYPTDPRRYVVETDDGSIVHGMRALDAYAEEFRESGTLPAPTVFYHVTEATDGIDAIQYWMYSVFDQFTVNFHWHDWELLQVFVDQETGEPRLVSASAHSRGVPNNEFYDPAIPDDRRPGLLAEVGSHSSASELNGLVPSFERHPGTDWQSDVTNDLVDVARNLAVPFAYGLPRDEGARLPFVMPELDGTPLHEHPSMSVDRGDFIAERVTVSDWLGLPRPPEEIPERKPGRVLTHPESPTSADTTYELVPIEHVAEIVDDFVGPQLGFAFLIPGFVEDQLSSHITSVGIPWEQDRFTDPLDDVTDPGHRRRLDGTIPEGLQNRVAGRVRRLQSGADGALDRVADDARAALLAHINVSRGELPVEVAVRLASPGPEVTVTRGGVFGYVHVEPGEHLLAVNGPGYEPMAQRFVHEGGLVHPGPEGELTVVPRQDAAWIRVDGRGTGGIDHVTITEEYAGIVYDGRPVADDRFGVAVHRSGTYTVEIIDNQGQPGGFNVSPADLKDGELIREGVETGKVALLRLLQDELFGVGELARDLRSDADEQDRLQRLLAQAVEEIDPAIDHALNGDAESANQQTAETIDILEEARRYLRNEDQRLYDAAAVAALDPRLIELIERAEIAIETPIRS